MPESPDPFTQVYTALWDALTANAGLKALVRLGNQAAYAGKAPFPIKPVVQVGDLPELILGQSMQAMEGPYTTWQTQDLQQVYTLSMAFADLQIVPVNQLKWYIQQAVNVGWANGAFTGFDFSIAMRMQDGKDSAVGNGTRSGKAWASVISIKVDFFVSLVDVLP